MNDSLQVIYSLPVTLESVPPFKIGKSYIPPRQLGILLEGAVVRDGKIIFLARRSDLSSSSYVILDNVERDGFQKPVPIMLKRRRVRLWWLWAPLVLLLKLLGMKAKPDAGIQALYSITIDNEGKVWVGGATDLGMRQDKVRHSLAYIAKLDSSGKSVWERDWDTGAFPHITSMCPTSTGNVIVAATDSTRLSMPSWLAMIAGTTGNVVWERQLGNGRGIAVTPVGDDAVLVATFDDTGTEAAYEEGVAVRRVTMRGEVGSPTIVRPAINKQPNAFLGEISMSPTNEGAYIVSSWKGPLEENDALFKPSEIAKVDPYGKLVWTARFPGSSDGEGTYCGSPAVTTLPNGDAFIIRWLKGQLHTHQFNSLSGEEKQDWLALPEYIDVTRQGFLSLFTRANGEILVSFTSRADQAGAGCSWLARLSVL